MMAAIKPTLVLIHGGWHIPKTYSKITSSLQSPGFEVHVPRLPSMNETRLPNTDLADDTALIRAYVESLVGADRHHALLRGQVGTKALHGLGLNTRNQHREGPIRRRRPSHLHVCLRPARGRLHGQQGQITWP